MKSSPKVAAMMTLIFVCVISASVAHAEQEVPITYQGRLTDAAGDPVPDGIYEVEVSIYPDSGGIDPASYISFFDVHTTLGFFTLQFDPGLELINPNMWIEIRVEGETLSPRQRITRAPLSAVTARVNGDIFTAPGVLELYPPDPCEPPDTCEPAVGIYADSIHSIKLNWPDPQGMTSSAVEIANEGNEGSRIWMYHPTADPPGPMVEINAHPTEGNSIVLHSAEPLLCGSGIFRATPTTGAVLELNHVPRPHEHVSVIELSSAPEDFGHIKMFNGRIEPPPVYLEMNTAYDGDQTGSNFILYNPDPANYGSPMVQMSTNTGGRAANASYVMFNPQPEPPGSDPDPFIELRTGEYGGNLNFYNETGKYMGVEPSPFYDGGALNMYHTVEGRPEYLAVAIDADADGGSMTCYNDAAKYMSVAPDALADGGAIKMFDTSGGAAVEINSSGEVIAGKGKFGQNNADGGWATFVAGVNNTSSANYSQLFAINGDLTQDSTFNVNMPHILFGDETNGYEFPTADGSTDQVLITNGAGQLSWADMATVAGEGNRQLLEIIEQLSEKVEHLENKIAELETR